MPEKIMNVQPFTNPMMYVPKAMFFTKGKGVHKDHLTSFELALRDAKISDLNIVSVSSIKPPKCKIISLQEGRNYLVPGQVVFVIIARQSTNEPNRLIAASVGLAAPADNGISIARSKLSLFISVPMYVVQTVRVRVNSPARQQVLAWPE